MWNQTLERPEPAAETGSTRVVGIAAASAANPRVDTALLILRLAAGTIFVAHGAQKFFMYGITGVIESFTQMGVPMAAVVAPMVARIELVGGLALLFGALTRLAAGLLGLVMLSAMLIVHLPNGFFLPMGIEFTLALLAMMTALGVAGPGSVSVDHRMLKRTV
jgi:putative oxidoreductase